MWIINCVINLCDREVYTGHILQQTDGEVLRPGLYSLEQPASNTVRGTIDLFFQYDWYIYIYINIYSLQVYVETNFSTDKFEIYSLYVLVFKDLNVAIILYNLYLKKLHAYMNMYNTCQLKVHTSTCTRKTFRIYNSILY